RVPGCAFTSRESAFNCRSRLQGIPACNTDIAVRPVLLEHFARPDGIEDIQLAAAGNTVRLPCRRPDSTDRDNTHAVQHSVSSPRIEPDGDGDAGGCAVHQEDSSWASS